MPNELYQERDKLPITIGIGGSHSGTGKTTLAAAILEYLTSRSSLPHPPLYNERRWGERWGAIKYTKTAFYSSLVADKTILFQKDKDTARFFDAGAEEVLWVQSPSDDINEVMPLAIDKLSHLDGIVIEGNSAIAFLKPDIVIFLVKDAEGKQKASANAVLKMADIIISAEVGATFSLSTLDIGELVKTMDKILNDDKIGDMLKERSRDDKVTCTAAREIAENLTVSYKKVGEAANKLKIRITECDLGCF
ncbi:MAG: hypothetical protein L0Y62_02705 [Nitrospirae bacterium]|nr:hypothetical protein [Nitrospirota bacterium]